MRNVRFLLAALCFGLASALAHPGVGIVADSKGNIFYTDLRQVWKIATDGSRTIAVENVHTHELWIDGRDNLYGEHLWYNGERVDTWGHRVWKLSADGHLSDVIPARKGFREDYGDFFFVRDSAESMYWAESGDTTSIRKRTKTGTATVVVRAPFRNVRWMTVTASGTVYLIDLQDLVRVTFDGHTTTIAAGLAEKGRSRSGIRDQHAVMGIWTDRKENTYAAVAADHVVKRISRDGAVNVIYRSTDLWSPSGGLERPDGTRFILEFNAANHVRVVRVAPDGVKTIFG